MQWVDKEELKELKEKNKIKKEFQKYVNIGYKQMKNPYENYCISSDGLIHNLLLDTDLKTYTYKEEHFVKLNGNDKNIKSFLLCELVAEYFLDKKEGKTKIWHKDRDKANNKVINLQYISESEYIDLSNGNNKNKLDGFKQMEEPYQNYYISNNGRIYSSKRDLFMGATKKGKYNTINISSNGKEKSFMLCNLVAEYFLPKVEGKNQVWHKNESFSDDRVENLQWVDDKEMKVLQDKNKAKNLTDEYTEKGFKIMNVPFETYAINKYGEIYNLVTNKKLSYDIKDGSHMCRLLGTNKKPKYSTVQNLVAEYFLEGEKKELIWQKDGDKFNVKAENLQWFTHKEYYNLKNKNKDKSKLDGYIQMNKPYENYYINKEGQIYSLHKEKVLETYIHKEDGYNHIGLYLGNDKKKDFVLHQLVAEYFLPIVDGKNKIWYKDGDKTNYCVDNLQWVTEAEWKEKNIENNKKKLLDDELKEYVEIEGQGGYYYINKEGKIYSFYKNRFLKQHENNDGYLEIGLKSGIYRIHRLVAVAFIPKLKNKNLVNHKDGNKRNCNLINLEWSDYIHNAKHAHATGLHPKNKNVNEYIYYQLDEDGEVIEKFKSISDINNKFGNGKWSHKFRDVIGEIDNDLEELEKMYGYYWKREKINHIIYNDEEWSSLNVGNKLDEFISVSNYGRVRNEKTGHYYVVCKGKDKNSKYFRVTIKYNDTKYSCSVHRLVALSFLENKLGKEAHVDHIDKNPENNHLSNLQWLLPKEHMKKDKGISVTEVKDNGEITVYDMMTEAAEEICVNVGQISTAIKEGHKYKNSYWYRTSEYNEELHKKKINELEIKKQEKEENEEKEVKTIKKIKKKRGTAENLKRKERNKIDKEKLKKINECNLRKGIIITNSKIK